MDATFRQFCSKASHSGTILAVMGFMLVDREAFSGNRDRLGLRLNQLLANCTQVFQCGSFGAVSGTEGGIAYGVYSFFDHLFGGITGVPFAAHQFCNDAHRRPQRRQLGRST